MHATTIREEHAGFARRLDEVRSVADAVGALTPDELARRVQDVHGFLADTLVPHLVAERTVLFPEVRSAAGDGAISLAMDRCSGQLASFTDELEHLASGLPVRAGPEAERTLRRLLYGIHAIASAHLDATTADLDPLLEERMPPDARARLLDAVDRCADEIRAVYD